MSTKNANLMQNLGVADAWTGGQLPPAQAMLAKSLLVGLPTYGLTRWLTPKVSKQYDPHRTGIAAAIAATGLASIPQIQQMNWNIGHSSGLGKIKNINKPIGTIPPSQEDMQYLKDINFQPSDAHHPYMGPFDEPKQSDYTGGSDYAGSMRTGKLHNPSIGRGTSKLGTMVKRSNNMGTAATEGNSYETKPSYEESVSPNDVNELARQIAHRKMKGSNIALSSSDVQPMIHPSDDEVMNKIVKDGSLNDWAAKAASLVTKYVSLPLVKSALEVTEYDPKSNTLTRATNRRVTTRKLPESKRKSFTEEHSKQENDKDWLDKEMESAIAHTKSSAMTRYLVEDIVDKCAMYEPDMTGAYGNYDTFNPPGAQGMGIPSHYTMQQIDNDPYMSPQEKSRAMMVINHACDGRPGLISAEDVSRAAVGLGIGYASASLFGKVLSGIFGGIGDQAQKRLTQAGMVAGMLGNTGVLR